MRGNAVDLGLKLSTFRNSPFLENDPIGCLCKQLKTDQSNYDGREGER